MSRPASERPDDALPSPDDFAGWPPLGALSLRAAAGPVVAEMSRLNAAVGDALAPFAASGAARSSVAPLTLRLQWTRAERPAWLTLQPGDRARSVAWREGDGLAWATHHVALLMDSTAERGIVVMTDQTAAEAARSAQNVLRVAAAWRLAASQSGLLLHASAVSHERGAVVFVGPSGAGKSTVAGLSAPRPVLADDACIVTADGRKVTLHPAPFWAEPGFPGRSDDLSPVVVAGMYRLRQGERHAASPMARAFATAAIVAHAPFLTELSPVLEVTTLAGHIAGTLRPAELEFARDAGFWRQIDAEMSSRHDDSAEARRDA